MALPQLNHKNVVRYFGSWIEQVDNEDEKAIQKIVEGMRQRINQQKTVYKEEDEYSDEMS